MFLLSNVVREPVELFEKKCEELPERVCPACGSEHLIKNGSVHNGNSKHQCKSCAYQFVDNPTKNTVSSETKHLIDRLLLERISLRGIARVTQVSWSWLQDLVLVTRLCESKAEPYPPPDRVFSQITRWFDH